MDITLYAETFAVTSPFWSVPAQFWSMIWTTCFVIFASIWVWFVMRKADPKEEPTTAQMLITNGVEGMNNYFNGLTNGNLRKMFPYFFSVFIYLTFAVFIGMLGFESPASSFMFTFALGLVSFIGIYVVGITSKGIYLFIREKYKNPLELFSQFAPLLSLSIRLFGGTFAMGILFVIMSLIFESMGFSTVATFWPIINVAWFWMLKSVDVFLSMVQALVFVSLTAVYWSLEYGPRAKEEHAMKMAEKRAKKLEMKNGKAVISQDKVDIEKVHDPSKAKTVEAKESFNTPQENTQTQRT